jgi:small-conductance mechanosensitive channel
MRDLMHLPVWPIILILGYPALTIAVLEFARRLAVRAPFASGILRQVAYVLLPTGGIWLILRVLAELPANDWAARTAETAFALTGLYLLLRVAQASLMSLVDEQMRAPKLLLDILRIGLSLVWGSVVVSRIWNVNLGSLLAAMGVGSIALAFALQEFLGNLLSGLGLLSAHKFSIGDWIMVDGKAAEVVEMDWRTVTLVTAAGNRVVVANSTLDDMSRQQTALAVNCRLYERRNSNKQR